MFLNLKNSKYVFLFLTIIFINFGNKILPETNTIQNLKSILNKDENNKEIESKTLYLANELKNEWLNKEKTIITTIELENLFKKLEDLIKSEINSEKTKTLYYCDFCDLTDKSEDTIINHINSEYVQELSVKYRTETKTVYICPCGLDFLDKAKLDDHIKNIHTIKEIESDTIDLCLAEDIYKPEILKNVFKDLAPTLIDELKNTKLNFRKISTPDYQSESYVEIPETEIADSAKIFADTFKNLPEDNQILILASWLATEYWYNLNS